MPNKTLNTRIKLKYDTLANWQSNNPVLLAGEVAVVAVNSTPTETVGSVETPQILFKVGDGTSTFNNLKYASGLAADVYSWAKAATKPSYTAIEVGADATGSAASALEDAKEYTDSQIELLSGELETDTDTQYRLRLVGQTLYLDYKDKNTVEFTENGTAISLGSVFTLTTGTTNGTVSFNGTEVPVAGLGSAAYTDSTDYATAAQGTKADSAVQSVTIGSTLLTGSDGDVSITASAARTALELGAAATKGTVDSISDSPSANLPTESAVKNYVDGILSANDAMIFKGTVGADGTITSASAFNSLTGYKIGWTYRVIEAGTYAGYQCEIGDLLIAVADYGSAFSNSDWTVAQTNIDGAVTAQSNLISDYLVSANGSHSVEDSGIKVTEVVTKTEEEYLATGKLVVGVGGSGIRQATTDVTETELSYVEGVTSSIQTQLDGKMAVPTSGIAGNLTEFNGTRGVVDSGIIADNVVTATANLTNSQLVVGNGTKGLQTLANGTAGQVLTAGADGLSWTTLTDNDTKLTTVTANNGLTGSVTNGTTLTIGIDNISTDLLSQGTNTLIFDCGTSSL